MEAIFIFLKSKCVTEETKNRADEKCIERILLLALIFCQSAKHQEEKNGGQNYKEGVFPGPFLAKLVLENIKILLGCWGKTHDVVDGSILFYVCLLQSNKEEEIRFSSLRQQST